MNMKTRSLVKLVGLILLLSNSSYLKAQQGPVVNGVDARGERVDAFNLNKFFGNFQFGVSLGYLYGNNNLSFNDGQFLIDPNTQQFYLYKDNTRTQTNTYSYHSSWLTSPTGDGSVTGVGFDSIPRQDVRATNRAIPFQILMAYKIKDVVRIGGGVVLEDNRVSELRTEIGEQTFTYQAPDDKYFVSKIFGHVGIVLYEPTKVRNSIDKRYSEGKIKPADRATKINSIRNMNILLELQGGVAVAGGNVSSGNYINLGLSVEHNISEYMAVFVKPQVEVRQMSFLSQETIPLAFDQQKLLGGVSFGVNISIPSIKRCPIPNCHVVMKHRHNGVEFRGSPFWQNQNRKVGQWRKDY